MRCALLKLPPNQTLEREAMSCTRASRTSSMRRMKRHNPTPIQHTGTPPSVISVESRDIGEWSDDHPLNKTDTADEFARNLFGKKDV